MKDSFQHRFIEAMQIRGMRQVDVAEKSGLDKAQISQYKTGKYEPMQDALYKLAKALDVNVAWLMGHDVPMEVNRTELEQKIRVCDLIEKCYGSNAYELIELFIRLNDTGKQVAIDTLKAWSTMPQYTTAAEKGDNEKMA
jgi:transcriptional regulator with XRE-family HTH domain